MSRLMEATAGEEIAALLLQWFATHARSLPWRATYDPYHVWLSEIMLQQTQMERGVSYFRRWLLRFPTVEAVAKAELEDILKAWEGLGYYARARNLHLAAQRIVGEHGGIVPSSYQVLLELPGIGPYTAAAIASIAGNEDVAVIDANVMRVYARLFDIDTPLRQAATRKRLGQLAARLLPCGQARYYNQALMDFGALVCLPRSPRCGACPLRPHCLAEQAGTVASRPLAVAKRMVENLVRVAALIVDEGKVLIAQRPAEAVWGGLWEFPGGEVAGEEPKKSLVRQVRQQTGLSVVVEREITTVHHQYTHHRVRLTGFFCSLAETGIRRSSADLPNYRWVPVSELGVYAFPAGPRKVLHYLLTVCPEVLDGS